MYNRAYCRLPRTPRNRGLGPVLASTSATHIMANWYACPFGARSRVIEVNTSSQLLVRPTSIPSLRQFVAKHATRIPFFCQGRCVPPQLAARVHHLLTIAPHHQKTKTWVCAGALVFILGCITIPYSIPCFALPYLPVPHRPFVPYHAVTVPYLTEPSSNVLYFTVPYVALSCLTYRTRPYLTPSHSTLPYFASHYFT